MIHFVISIVYKNPFVTGMLMGLSLLFPFAYFVYDFDKNPEKYLRK